MDSLMRTEKLKMPLLNWAGALAESSSSECFVGGKQENRTSVPVEILILSDHPWSSLIMASKKCQLHTCIQNKIIFLGIDWEELNFPQVSVPGFSPENDKELRRTKMWVGCVRSAIPKVATARQMWCLSFVCPQQRGSCWRTVWYWFTLLRIHLYWLVWEPF